MSAKQVPCKHESLRKGMALIRALSGHEYRGQTLTELAAATGIHSATACKILQSLQDMGMAKRDARDEKKWRLGPALVQMSLAFQHQLAADKRDLADFETTYTRKPI